MDALFDDIPDAFSGFDWQSALEVAILALVFFALLRLLRGTTAMTVVRGILVVAVLVIVLSRALDSVVLDWLVNNALAVLVLFVLIVFQPEFRRALERVGRAGGLRIWLGLRREDYTAVVPVLGEVVERLSEKHVGALLVLERETGLQEVAETGIAVDARPSVELLESLFYKASPLHDGAVLLRPDQVVAAACILPSSTNMTMGTHRLGTRHRAAVGITEQTDAIVVVVSEESGIISLASNGHLIRRLDRRRLETFLQSLLHRNGREIAETQPAALEP